MAKTIDDDGHCLVATKPFRPGRRVYQPDKLPDAVQCVGGLILVNDRGDASARQRDPVEAQSQAVVPSVDLAAMAREQVALAVRSLPQQPAPQVRMIEAQPQQSSENLASLAQAMLEMSDHINKLMVECAELREEVETINRIRVITDVKVDAA